MDPRPTLYLIDACSGSGMLGLAVDLALDFRVRTVAYVEREAHAAATLVARMEDKTLDPAPVWDDINTATDREFLEVVDGFRPLILCAGYPCQPFSFAGRRSGKSDPRHLWPAISRLTQALKPECVFFENVPGHLRMGFDEVRRDLQGQGYSVAAGLFRADEVGASHKRERLFIVGIRYANSGDRQGYNKSTSRLSGSSERCEELGHAEGLLGQVRPEPEGQQGEDAASSAGVELADSEDADGRCGRTQGAISKGERRGGCCCHSDELEDPARVSGGERADGERVLAEHQEMADADEERGRQGDCRGVRDEEETCNSMPIFAPGPGDDQWSSIIEAYPWLAPATQHGLRRVADGLACGMDADRLRLTGNGVVPLQAAYAFVSLIAVIIGDEVTKC